MKKKSNFCNWYLTKNRTSFKNLHILDNNRLFHHCFKLYYARSSSQTEDNPGSPLPARSPISIQLSNNT